MRISLRALPWILAVLQALPVCRLAGQSLLSTQDSVEVVRAFWRLATSSAQARDVAWLWTPSQADSESVAISPAIRLSVTTQGVPASARRPVGDDTVVFRISEWRDDSGGVRLVMASFRSTVLGSGARRCRTISGNSGSVRVRRIRGRWEANWDGPGVHGAQVCRPVSFGRHSLIDFMQWSLQTTTA